MEVESDRRYRFSSPPEEVWAALARVEDYQRWWPWLGRFDASALATGERWRCEVHPPLPYRVCFELHIDDVVAGQSVTASVAGDITGTAHFALRPVPDGTELHLVSSLAPSTRTLGAMLRLLSPVARYGHDWVIDTGLRQFESRALAGAPD